MLDEAVEFKSGIVLFYLIAINAFTFVLFGRDKWLAQNHRWRIRERNLLLVSLLGGAVGADQYACPPPQNAPHSIQMGAPPNGLCTGLRTVPTSLVMQLPVKKSQPSFQPIWHSRHIVKQKVPGSV